jgi:hypothetical protein
MLAAIENGLAGLSPSDRATAYKTWGQEDRFFVEQLLQLNKRGSLLLFKCMRP